MSRRYSFALIGVVVLAFVVGAVVRGNLDFDLSAPTIQARVAGLHWKGPLLYLALVIFRQFLLLPSMVLLPVGGLCFGALMGTALGSVGIFLSGLMKFSLARGVRRNWTGPALGPRWRALGSRLDGAGPLVIGITTAHPIGPMAALHWGAGLSTVRLGSFLIAVAIGGVIRAGTYALFGSVILTPGTQEFYLSGALLLVVGVAPFLHPGTRRRIFTAPTIEID